jgi:hypothetical protein
MTLVQSPPFESYAALRVAHRELRDRPELADRPSAAQLGEVAAFVDRVHATGALLNTREDRIASQTILDYWAGLLARGGWTRVDATLVPLNADAFEELPDALCPYPGARAYSAQEDQLFAGRAAVVLDLVDRLATRRVVAVVGPRASEHHSPADHSWTTLASRSTSLSHWAASSCARASVMHARNDVPAN